MSCIHPCYQDAARQQRKFPGEQWLENTQKGKENQAQSLYRKSAAMDVQTIARGFHIEHCCWKI